MSGNSGKTSGSTIWGALKRRLSGIGRRSEKQERKLNRGWTRQSFDEPVRNIESFGYAKHKTPSGSEIYLSTLEDDLFFDSVEPKPAKGGGRFADEAFNMIKSKDSEKNPFVVSPCFSKSPQSVVTSSTGIIQTENLEETEYETCLGYVSEPITGISETEEHTESKSNITEVERLPAAPVVSIDKEIIEERVSVDSESLEPSKICDTVNCSETLEKLLDAEEQITLEVSIMIETPILVEHQITDEEPIAFNKQIFDKGFDGIEYMSALCTCKYPELAPLAEILALPQEIEFSTTPNPPRVILLSEAADYGTICEAESGCFLQGYEVFSHNVGTEDTTSIENILVNYADFAGYDFLPEVTIPIKRKPAQRKHISSTEPENTKVNKSFTGLTDCVSADVGKPVCSDPISEAAGEEKVLWDAVYDIPSAPKAKPMISFIFGNGTQSRNFY